MTIRQLLHNPPARFHTNTFFVFFSGISLFYLFLSLLPLPMAADLICIGLLQTPHPTPLSLQVSLDRLCFQIHVFQSQVKLGIRPEAQPHFQKKKDNSISQLLVSGRGRYLLCVFGGFRERPRLFSVCTQGHDDCLMARVWLVECHYYGGGD